MPIFSIAPALAVELVGNTNSDSLTNTLANTASAAAEPAKNLLHSVNWSAPTWDLFIVLFFVVGAIVYGLSLGRDRIMVLLVASYMALAVITAAPEQIIVKDLFVIRVSAFVGAFLILFFLLSRTALLKTIAAADTRGSWWQVFLFSVLHVGLLISITLSFLPESALSNLSPTTRHIFADPTAHFLWVLGPVLLMIVLRGGASGEKKFKYDL